MNLGPRALLLLSGAFLVCASCLALPKRDLFFRFFCVAAPVYPTVSCIEKMTCLDALSAGGLVLPAVVGWQEWTWTTEGPGPRVGHSFHLFNDSVFVFGGRANDIVVRHNPRSFEVVNVAGELEFSTYEDNPVRPCPPHLTEEECFDINIGLFHNDLWQYNLDCVRWADLGCQFEGWHPVDRGARHGGCRHQPPDYTELHCSHPTERYDHVSTIFEDGTLFVYGGFSWKCRDYCSDMWEFNISACALGEDDGCSWAAVDDLGGQGPGKRWRSATAAGSRRLYLFGGHRLWQGFAQENTVANRWNDTARFPYGGYLDDLWEYSHDTKEWTQIIPLESCYAAPGDTWEERFDVRCTIHWPEPRASASMVLFGNSLYLHGGFTTFYPYPHLDGRGAAAGVGRRESDGPAPYPSHPYYLGDFWRFNLNTRVWERMEPVNPGPSARRDHAMVVVGDLFFLFGGYSSNFFLNDFWIYNITRDRWIPKDTFVHPLLPSDCVSDVVVQDDGSELVVNRSVAGQPTRFTELDGEAGRASEHAFVPQPRRARPGWDGCRDRVDGRTDLPNRMQWKQPSQRAGMDFVFAPAQRMMLLYGGRSFVREELPRRTVTQPAHVLGDMWQYRIDTCPQNCSQHGDCFLGFCLCHEGWYGVDCSNTSCPGDFCFYNPDTWLQECQHCCAAVYRHFDGEQYTLHERKVPCTADQPGESHGICDGFGTCQCAPPFLTKDCATRDCPNDCSGNGWCSVEFPVSRCMCDPGWVGDDCSERLCLNNCTFPNGECVDGRCRCVMNPNPFNRTLDFEPFAGEDCSFIVPFAGVTTSSYKAGLAVAALVTFVLASVRWESPWGALFVA